MKNKTTKPAPVYVIRYVVGDNEVRYHRGWFSWTYSIKLATKYATKADAEVDFKEYLNFEPFKNTPPSIIKYNAHVKQSKHKVHAKVSGKSVILDLGNRKLMFSRDEAHRLGDELLTAVEKIWDKESDYPVTRMSMTEYLNKLVPYPENGNVDVWSDDGQKRKLQIRSTMKPIIR